MATQNYFFSLSQPVTLPDGSTSQTPIGTGITVGTSSAAGAQVELRVLTTTLQQNVNNAAGSNVGVLTAREVIKALERFEYFIRQRGFIQGSGGPSGAWILP